MQLLEFLYYVGTNGVKKDVVVGGQKGQSADNFYKPQNEGLLSGSSVRNDLMNSESTAADNRMKASTLSTFSVINLFGRVIILHMHTSSRI